VTKLNWDRAAKRGLVQARGADPIGRPPAPKRKPKGITNAQARELARLRRKQGLPYDGRGMTAGEAYRAIANARRSM
jgi:hypothetical protein